jgi:hypothetical protein
MDNELGSMADVLAKLRREAESLGVPQVRRHIFLCCDQSKPECSTREQSLAAWEYLKARLKELKLTGAGGIYRTKANCLPAPADRSRSSIPRAPGMRAAIRQC